MKKVVLALCITIAVVFSAFAATHDHSMHDGMHKKEDAGAMGKVVFKGEKKGVSVKAELNDVESAMKAMMKDKSMKIDMSKMDPNLTHHLAVTINTTDKAGAVKSANLSLTYKNDKKSYSLMSMHGHFGSDISLKEKGTYKAVLTVETEKAGKVNFEFTLKRE
ncbi:MAG: hypothetical protein OHK0040_02210 [bacterium]